MHHACSSTKCKVLLFRVWQGTAERNISPLLDEMNGFGNFLTKFGIIKHIQGAIWLCKLPLRKLLQSGFPWSVTLTLASSSRNQKARPLLKPNKFPARQVYGIILHVIMTYTIWTWAWHKPQRKLLLMTWTWHKGMKDTDLLNMKLVL